MKHWSWPPTIVLKSKCCICMAQVSITCLWIILHALQKIVFVVNYIEIDPYHRHKYFTCWGHSLNWQNLCSLWHLNLSQNSRVYLTLFVWHLSLLTLKWFDLILVVAFEFANKSSIYFIECHCYVVNSMRIMRIKWGSNFHSTTNFLDTWDEIITSSLMGAMNTYVVCMHHKILFGNLVFTYAYSQQVLNDVLFFSIFQMWSVWTLEDCWKNCAKTKDTSKCVEILS